MHRATWRTTIVLLVTTMFTTAGADGAVQFSLISDASPGPGARHGAGKLQAALEARGISAETAADAAQAQGDALIVMGLANGDGLAAQLLPRTAARMPESPEALVIRHTLWQGKRALLICGSDDRGLMYAELDVADRLGWAANVAKPLEHVRDTIEQPAVAERALSVYTMHRRHFESRFHDAAHWARYLDGLAESRFNTFVLIFGYENWGYFAPPYPYFFDVDGFDDVRVVGITKAEQHKNLTALNRLIDMTHARGLRFTVGIWDHIYRGGVQGPTAHAKQRTPGLVWGLNKDNLVPYSKAALAAFLERVPGLDGIQFRMHGESGLERSEMHAFWGDIYDIMKRTRPELRFDARAKGFPDSLVDLAVEKGVAIRICTKYWAEQMGMPFHPTHINRQNQFDRRHGYADLLRYPQRYKMNWRLWNGGTTRVLLWGDPDYVRRFADSSHLYDGVGFEVNEPLATKMQDHPHDTPPFELLGSPYRYYDWEFERYWHFFQLFGRLSYNPDTPVEVWRREFERRFGRSAAPYVEQALHRASQVLPRIVATCFPYNRFPTTRGWVEKQRREDLPVYAKAEPSDIQQFLSIDEAARLRLEGGESAKVSPERTSEWFDRAANDVLVMVQEAERFIGSHRNKEFASTVVDLKILANLARYHSRRIHAGLAWALYTRAGDLYALDDAIGHERQAIAAWEGIVEAAGDVYHENLMMGRPRAGLSGHWKDELVALRDGLAKLETQRRQFEPRVDGDGPTITHVPIRKAAPGHKLVIRATVSGREPIANVRVGYGGPDAAPIFAPMLETGTHRYQAAIPLAKTPAPLTYWIEATDQSGRRQRFPAGDPTDRVAVTVTTDDRPPTVIHERITSAPASQPLRISAEVSDPSGVKWVRLRYRGVNQHFDYKTLPMRAPEGSRRYATEVPAEDIDPKWDFMYFIEVMDRAGNGHIHPDLETETPYVIVKLQRGPVTP